MVYCRTLIRFRPERGGCRFRKAAWQQTIDAILQAVDGQAQAFEMEIDKCLVGRGPLFSAALRQVLKSVK